MYNEKHNGDSICTLNVDNMLFLQINLVKVCYPAKIKPQSALRKMLIDIQTHSEQPVNSHKTGVNFLR